MKPRIFFLILIIAMTAVFSACQKKPNNIVNQPENNAVIENNQDEVATTTEEINTSDWQTYRNEEYGFELKYPEDIKIEKFASAPNTVGLLLNFGDTTLFVTSKNDTKKIDDNNVYAPYYFIESPIIIKKVLDRWEYGKLIYENKKEIVIDEILPRFCSKNDSLVCFDYYIEGDLFTKKDIIYHDNNRYEFSIVLSSGLNWDRINRDNDPEKRNIEIYTQTKNSSINYLNNIFTEEEKKKNDEMEKIKQSLLFK